MTLRDALLESKRTGEVFMRIKFSGWFISWHDEAIYKFSADDIVADDWVSVGEGIPKLTDGRWGPA